MQGNTFVLQILILFPRFFGVLFSFLQFDLAMVNTEECVVRLQGGVMCKETWFFLQILIFFSDFFFPTVFFPPPVGPGDGRRGGMCCPIARGLDSFSEFVVS